MDEDYALPQIRGGGISQVDSDHAKCGRMFWNILFHTALLIWILLVLTRLLLQFFICVNISVFLKLIARKFSKINLLKRGRR